MGPAKDKEVILLQMGCLVSLPGPPAGQEGVSLIMGLLLPLELAAQYWLQCYYLLLLLQAKRHNQKHHISLLGKYSCSNKKKKHQ